MTESPLRRVLGLPLLLFYGVGVTVGAGIFALIGELVGVAGDATPLVFLLAAVVAGVSAGSYAFLSSRIPRAAGAAVYARAGFGVGLARITGIGVVLTGVVSGSVVALAFGSYLSTIVPVPPTILAIALVAALTLVACLGVRESVLVAAAVTVIEVGTLLVVIVAGLPEVTDPALIERIVTPPPGLVGLGTILAGITIAFYAFIGFEDIVNMAEETKRPERTMAKAVVLTLAITSLIYLLVATIAVAVGDRIALESSDAPMADLFAELTGGSPAPIAAIAAAAMINGVLVQIIMASRVLYGMASDGMLPAPALARVHRRRKTPVFATILVAAVTVVLLFVVPIVNLAEATSYVTLAVFTVVNLSLWRVMRRSGDRGHKAKAAWGLAGAAITLGLLVADVVRRVGGLG